MAAAANPESIGRYQIIKCLGKGGMGAVYLAQDPAIDRLVAIKLLLEGLETDELRERFQREARSAGRLRHNNIVVIFDVGEDDGRPFIAMEYVHGHTLSELIKHRAVMTVMRKLQMLEQLCDGLAYAHWAGVIHRDIKPANLIVDEKDALKILDFGIARLGPSGMTMAGALMGTLNYMAPEQMVGRPVDSRTDIFAVGACCYELLAYRRAFPGDLQDGILHRILYNAPEPIEKLVPDLDPEVVRIVNRALEKDPERRYQDLEAMRNELQRIRQRLEGREGGQFGPRQAGPIPTPLPISLKTPRGGTDREQLAKFRTQQIEMHLDAARQAFDAGKFDDVLTACHQVLLLDPDNVVANDLLDRAKVTTETRQVKDILKQARARIDSGNVDDASRLLKEALSLHPTSAEGLEIRGAVDKALQEREAARARLRDLDHAVDRARNALKSGEADSAVRAADEALAIDRDNSEARTLRQKAAAVIEERRRLAEQRRAERAIEGAVRQFEAGDHEAACKSLESYTPPNDQVTAALKRLQQAGADLEKRRAEEDARAKGAVGEAWRRFKAGEQSSAISLLEAFRPEHPIVAAALGELRRALTEVEQRRQVEDQRAEQAVDDAQRRFDGGDYGGALTVLEGHRPPHPRVERALEVLRTARGEKQENRKAVDEARRLADDGKYAEAITLLETHDSTSETVGTTLAEIRRRAEEADRQTREGLQKAERKLHAGEYKDATVPLDALHPADDALTMAVNDLQQKASTAERQPAGTVAGTPLQAAPAIPVPEEMTVAPGTTPIPLSMPPAQKAATLPVVPPLPAIPVPNEPTRMSTVAPGMAPSGYQPAAAAPPATPAWHEYPQPEQPQAYQPPADQGYPYQPPAGQGYPYQPPADQGYGYDAPPQGQGYGYQAPAQEQGYGYSQQQDYGYAPPVDVDDGVQAGWQGQPGAASADAQPVEEPWDAPAYGPQPEVAPRQAPRKTGLILLAACVGVAAVVVAIVVVLGRGPEPPPPPQKPGTLALRKMAPSAWIQIMRKDGTRVPFAEWGGKAGCNSGGLEDSVEIKPECVVELAPGEYNVRATPTGPDTNYRPYEYTVTVKSGEIVELNDVWSKHGELQGKSK